MSAQAMTRWRSAMNDNPSFETIAARKPANTKAKLARENLRLARALWPGLPPIALQRLRYYSQPFSFSLAFGDVLFIDHGWYVTHAGLLRLAERRHCAGMHVTPVLKSSDPANSRWVFRAVVFKSRSCKGFVGYGDADPSNTSDLVRGAEMRVAETRAVNRALRKAYGIGICSVEEIGSYSKPPASEDKGNHRPPQSVNGNDANGQHRLRDRLCQLIRQHQLDPVLVKSYAVDFCGVKTLKEASREQVENFVDHVADWAAKDKNALLCQLNGYMGKHEVVA